MYLNLKHQPNMDNPEDNYQFEFHAKVPENDKNHFWFNLNSMPKRLQTIKIIFGLRWGIF
ncbi:hypothetical protein VN0127_11700 [Helicobacter pylori]